jgi:hypothetical protein
MRIHRQSETLETRKWKSQAMASSSYGSMALMVDEEKGMFEHLNGGFSVCLVVAKHARHGCDFSATFGLGMRKLPGAKLL